MKGYDNIKIDLNEVKMGDCAFPVMRIEINISVSL
jgi:hypothetical protein